MKPAPLATVVQLPRFDRGAGTLSPLEFGTLPFVPRRDFFTTGARDGVIRGGHAHRRCHQLLRCAAGTVYVTVTRPDGHEARWKLIPHDKALHVPPRRWVEIHELRATDVIHVLASRPYEEDDYVRTRADFLRLRL